MPEREPFYRALRLPQTNQKNQPPLGAPEGKRGKKSPHAKQEPDDYTPGNRTTRNPPCSYLASATQMLRKALRQCQGPLVQEPPSSIR